MSDVNIATEKAASFHNWFEAGGAGENFAPNYDTGVARFEWFGDKHRHVETIYIGDFIGSLMYFEALQMEEQTGYRVDASVLVREVVAAYQELPKVA